MPPSSPTLPSIEIASSSRNSLTSHGEHPVTKEGNKEPATSPGRCSEALGDPPSVPNLQDPNAPASETGLPTRNPLSRTQFRVGRVGLNRAHTRPRYMMERIDGLPIYSGRHLTDLNNLTHFVADPHSDRRRSLMYGSPVRAESVYTQEICESRSQTRPKPAHPTQRDPSAQPFDPPRKSAHRIRGPKYVFRPLESLKKRKSTIEQAAPFWEGYNMIASFEDKEFIKAVGVNLDTLLIFAGLFSAVNTAFIIEALQTLQLDQAETTNHLLRSVVLILHNHTFIEDSSLHTESFDASLGAFRSSALFFISLCFSLTAAFGAVMGKQWLDHYERQGGIKPDADRGKDRQRKYEARSRWHMRGVIESLPTLLQISVFLFFVALVDFLRQINLKMAHIVMAFSLVPVLIFIGTTVAAIIDPTSPFQTYLSVSIRERLPVILGLPHFPIPSLLLNAWFNLKRHSKDYSVRFQAQIDRAPPFIRISVYLLMKPFSFIGVWMHNLPITDELATLLSLNFYLQRASVLKDHPALLAGINSLPIHPSGDLDHSFLEPLVKSAITCVLTPAWNFHLRDAIDELQNFDFRCVLKLLHLAYTHYGYGGYLDYNGPLQRRYLLHEEADAWIIQEVYDALFRDQLDFDSASMAAEVMSKAGIHDIQCSETNLEALCQYLECPSQHPRHYLPYISLLSHAGGTIEETRSNRVLHALTSSMWIDGKPDLDFRRGRFRLQTLSSHLDNNKDEFRFSKYLLVWKGAAEGQDVGVSSEWFSLSYTETIRTLLDSQQNSHFWPQKLEEDGHVTLLVDSMKLSSSPLASISNYDALYSFLTLWYRRCVVHSANNVSGQYVTQEAVEEVVAGWASGHFRRSAAPDKHKVTAVVEHTLSYLEEARRLSLLGLHDLTQVFEMCKGMAGDHLKNYPDLHQPLLKKIDGTMAFMLQPTNHDQGHP